jgi:beta-lactam-binding protein with PASTA domain|tara:strand:+ start:98 stop:316 length:219 start_codon:yes stop_codon:yes gene_type:complete
MIIDILIFIAGVIAGVLITLNNTRKVRAVANKLEEEAQELRVKVEREVKNRRRKQPPAKKKTKKVLTSPPRV